MNAGLVDYGYIGRSITIGSQNFYPICNLKRKRISRLRDPYIRRRLIDFPAMEQFKLQIMATGGNEKLSEVDPNNAIPPFEVAKELLPSALVWTSLHGFVVGDRSVQRSGQVPGVGLTHAPFSLFPAPFPETCWSQACDLAPLFNELVDRVSMDGVFLQESLSGLLRQFALVFSSNNVLVPKTADRKSKSLRVLQQDSTINFGQRKGTLLNSLALQASLHLGRTRKVDDFTARLLDIHSKTLQDNIRQEIRLGLHRSDYMLDTETGSLLQIELNTISSSFAGLGCLVSQLHRYLIKHFGDHQCLDSKRVPENTAMKRYAEALALAWSEFNDVSSIVLVVVQPEERNMYDQHWICMLLKELYGVSTVRKTLAEIDAEGELLANGSLQIGQRVASVVYFRAGYTPIDYPSEAEWRARLMLEMSSAIKCPSISYQLAGSKKVQQELAKPNVLERFINNKDDALKLRKCFAGLWSLHYNAKIIQDAITRPEAFVLKPQREGGGNNIYGKDVKEKLLELEKSGGDGLAAYILMQRIFPPIHTSYLVRDGNCQLNQTVSELGIFGAYLRNKENVLINNQSGYLMRTKVSSSDEGGVAAGFAVLDSIYLT